MNNPTIEHFNTLESKCYLKDPKDYILWPTTEINEQIQDWISERYGLEDNILLNGSRPNVIYNVIRDLVANQNLSADFSVLDICCGDALILSQLKERFTDCSALGFDINKGKFDTHKQAEQNGVKLYYGFIQELFKTDLSQKMDVIIMLNTFRSWHTARLRKEDEVLPTLSQEWLIRNANYLILTVNNVQLDFFKSKFLVSVLGKGEEKSSFIMVRC